MGLLKPSEPSFQVTFSLLLDDDLVSRSAPIRTIWTFRSYMRYGPHNMTRSVLVSLLKRSEPSFQVSYSLLLIVSPIRGTLISWMFVQGRCHGLVGVEVPLFEIAYTHFPWLVWLVTLLLAAVAGLLRVPCVMLLELLASDSTALP